MNELIFILSVFIVSSATLGALKLGKEALIALISVEAVLANLFVIKHIVLGGFTATASDALAVGTTLGLNVLQEYYGKPTALKAIWISFYCALFYTVMSIIQVLYVPAPTDMASQAFNILLAPMPRVVCASLTTYLIVQHLDTALYGILKSHFHERYFIIRNYFTLALTQLTDTILFTFLGLYKLNESFSSVRTLFDIIIVSYSIKILVILIAVPFVRFAKRFIVPT
jgi:queuosine precursor transporter